MNARGNDGSIKMSATRGRRAIAGVARTLLPAVLAGAAIVPAKAAGGPCGEIARMERAQGTTGELAGWSVAIAGDVAIVGSIADDGNRGSATLYRALENGTWVEIQTITASDAKPGDWFGYAVDVDGDTVIVGAVHGDGGGGGFNEGEGEEIDSGAAYVFRDDGNGNWVQIEKLTPFDGTAGGRFGCSVAIEGDLAVVGASHLYNQVVNGGAAYVFQDEGAEGWACIGRRSEGSGEEYGVAVDVQAPEIFVGAHHRHVSQHGPYSGAVFAHRRVGEEFWEWVDVDWFFAEDGEAVDLFGGSLAVDGEVMIVGARGDDDRGENAGAAYVFTAEGNGQWHQHQKLTAAEGGPGDDFGRAVALAGDVALVSAPAHDGAGEDAGAVHVFRNDGDGSWIQVATLTASDAEAGDFFGWSVGIHHRRAIVGAWGGGAQDRGAAYVFDLACAFPAKATLTGVDVAHGSLLTGDLADLDEPDDDAMRTRSAPGQSIFEANLTEVVFEAQTDVPSPSVLKIVLEERVNNPGASGRVLLKNRDLGVFVPEESYGPRLEDERWVFDPIAAGEYVGPDGEIEMSIKHAVIATFSAIGFDSFFDLVEIGVQ